MSVNTIRTCFPQKAEEQGHMATNACCQQLSSTSICDFNSTLMAAALKFHATLQPGKTENEKETTSAWTYSCITESSSARNYLEVKLKESRSCSWPLQTLGKSNIIRKLFQAVWRELTLEEKEDEILCSFHVGRCEQVEIPCDEKRFKCSWWGHLDMCVRVHVHVCDCIVSHAEVCFLVWFSRLRDCHR